MSAKIQTFIPPEAETSQYHKIASIFPFLGYDTEHAHISNNHHKAAFTLAETLITLMTIGIVAALTIPSMMTSVNEFILGKQKSVFSAKFNDGLKRMRTNNELEGPYTTAEFINVMGKYFHISQVCDQNNLTKCFVEKIKTYESSSDGEEFEVKDLKAETLGGKEYNGAELYGLRLSDGTNMLLAYKPDCQGPGEADMGSSSTSCITYIYDVNNKKSPNLYGGNTGSGAMKNNVALTEKEKEARNKGRDMVGNASLSASSLAERIAQALATPCEGDVNDNCSYDGSEFDIYLDGNFVWFFGNPASTTEDCYPNFGPNAKDICRELGFTNCSDWSCSKP